MAGKIVRDLKSVRWDAMRGRAGRPRRAVAVSPEVCPYLSSPKGTSPGFNRARKNRARENCKAERRTSW